MATDNLTNDLLGLTLGLQAASLLGVNLKTLPKPVMKRGRVIRYKIPSNKRIIKTGVTNLLGVGLLGANAQLVNSLK